MTEQRLALVGPELEARLLSRCKKLTSKVLCYRNWSDCLAAMTDAAPAVVLGAMPNDTAFDALWQQRLQQRLPRQLSQLSSQHAGQESAQQSALQSTQQPLQQPSQSSSPHASPHSLQQRPPLPQPPLQAVNVPALVLLATAEQMDRALQLFQVGAYEYLASETDPEQIVATVAQALQRARPARSYPERSGETAGALIGESPAVRELHRALQQLGKVRVPVLVRGEPGTGKQLFARSLHQQSGVSGPLVEVNVGALARAALDIELFGLERQQNGESQLVRSGRVEEADGGTLFLDEVAELPLDVQLRLAQLLADGHYHRVGGYGDCHATLRVIAATRYSLETLVRNGQFQPDLYHRLTVVQVQLPRLQERKEDIEPLVQHFLTQVAAEMAVAPKQLAPAVLPILQQYEWPGNIRQLENLCRRLAVMVTEPVIEASHLPLEMQPELQIANEARGWEDALRSWAEQSLAAGHRNLLDVAQPVLERILLQAALKQTGGLKQEAALLLGWGRNTLTRKLRELSIETDDDDEAA